MPKARFASRKLSEPALRQDRSSVNSFIVNFADLHVIIPSTRFVAPVTKGQSQFAPPVDQYP
jgi:hypothetical protein